MSRYIYIYVYNDIYMIGIIDKKKDIFIKRDKVYIKERKYTKQKEKKKEEKKKAF